MSARDEILARVKRSQPAALALPSVPVFQRSLEDLKARFKESLAAMGGEFAEPAPGEGPDAVIRRKFADAGVICSAAPEVKGNRPIEALRGPAELEDVEVGVVRAAFGVAETGSVFLSEAELRVNALGFLPQHLVVLLDMADLVPDLHHAYARRGFHEARYAVLMSGPSATADIEGVLVRGAQGVRSLTVVDTPRAGG